MLTALLIVVLVLLILLAERVSILRLTRTAEGQAWVRRNRWLHPNSISLVRIPMGVLSMGLWQLGVHRYPDSTVCQLIALLWFAFWMITDLTDGTIARRCDLVTESGKWLDPLSDKCMYFPILLMFSIAGPLPLPWAVGLVVTDALGQASRLVSRKKAANYFGKVKTALITILLTLVAMDQISPLGIMAPERFEIMLHATTISCTLLALLSAYCKLIPDSWYANTLTFANLACGVAAVVVLLRGGTPLRAFILIFTAQFFDLFDGRVARKFGSTAYGALLDDIADGASFGVAIGVLIAHQLKSTNLWLAHAVALAYACCVVYRLYRFTNPTVKLPAGIFQGLPSPAGAMLAGSSVLFFGSHGYLGALLVLITAFLMISNIRYRHFGQRIWPSLPNGMRIVCFILLLLFLNMAFAHKDYAGAFKLFCFSMAWLYVLYGTEYTLQSINGAREAAEESQ